MAETSKGIAYQWSPNGSRIAYELSESTQKNIHEVFVASIQDGESRRLTEASFVGFRYKWSPSGESLALLAGRKILVFQFPDGKSQQVGSLTVPLFWRCFSMEWSPNEQSLVLILEGDEESAMGGSCKMFTVTVPDGRWTDMKLKSGGHHFAKWSPDGQWISYYREDWAKTQLGGTLWELEIDEYLMKMSQSGLAP